MNIQEQINNYLHSFPEPKRTDMYELHHLMLSIMPGYELWFLDGKNSEGKILSNPNIGYGLHTIQYTDGSSKAFYKIGISANNTGISVYIFGIDDKNYLSEKIGSTIGKATVTGYCIKFKKLSDINPEVLKSVILDVI